jgi:hypothetical protein
MQGQRHLRMHVGEAGTKEGAAVEPDGSRACKSGLRMAGSGDDGMSGWPSTTTGTTESGLGWRRLGFRRCPSRPISSNDTDNHATR